MRVGVVSVNHEMKEKKNIKINSDFSHDKFVGFSEEVLAVIALIVHWFYYVIVIVINIYMLIMSSLIKNVFQLLNI